MYSQMCCLFVCDEYVCMWLLAHVAMLWHFVRISVIIVLLLSPLCSLFCELLVFIAAQFLFVVTGIVVVSQRKYLLSSKLEESALNLFFVCFLFFLKYHILKYFITAEPAVWLLEYIFSFFIWKEIYTISYMVSVFNKSK